MSPSRITTPRVSYLSSLTGCATSNVIILSQKIDCTEDMDHDGYLVFSDATPYCHYYEPELVGIAESFVWNMESGSRYDVPMFTQMMMEMEMERYQVHLVPTLSQVNLVQLISVNTERLPGN